nr:hypothetical protein [Tanacetum cinerariifolium]
IDEIKGEDDRVCVRNSNVVEKKMNSRCVVENVLIRYGGSLVGNEGNIRYNKYKEGTLCKGMCVGMRVLFGEGLCVGKFRLEGLKMKMKNEDKDEIKGLI